MNITSLFFKSFRYLYEFSLFQSNSYVKSQKIYIHGDLKPDNLIIEGNKINCIDLDNSRYEIREMDFARIVRYIWEWPIKIDWLDRAKNFMNGYFKTVNYKIIPNSLCGSVIIQPFRECIWQFNKYISTQKICYFNRMQEEINFLDKTIPLMSEFELEMKKIIS